MGAVGRVEFELPHLNLAPLQPHLPPYIRALSYVSLSALNGASSGQQLRRNILSRRAIYGKQGGAPTLWQELSDLGDYIWPTLGVVGVVEDRITK